MKNKFLRHFSLICLCLKEENNMKEKITLCIMLLIFFSMLLAGCMDNSSLSNCAVIEGKGTYLKIQDAIDAASEGDTIHVYMGTYYESIILNKSIHLIGDGKDKTIIDYHKNDSGNIIAINKDQCTIKGFTITNSMKKFGSTQFIRGIEIDSANNLISDNSISNTIFGIQILPYSRNNTISGNMIFNNQDGIEIWQSSYNKLSSNNISLNSQFGVVIFEEAEYNVISSNTFSNNDEAVRLKDVQYNTIRRNVLINNTKDIIQCCGAKNNNIYENTYE